MSAVRKPDMTKVRASWVPYSGPVGLMANVERFRLEAVAGDFAMAGRMNTVAAAIICVAVDVELDAIFAAHAKGAQ